jgi:hypothetical protein
MQQVNTLTVSSLSPGSVQTDLTNHRNLRREIRRLPKCSTRETRRTKPCNCQPRSEKSIYLQWPIVFSQNQTIAHGSHCPYAAWEQALTDINVRLSFCSRALKRKFHLSIALLLSHGGGVQIAPTLTVRRIVSSDSPGFQLMKKRLAFQTKPKGFGQSIANELLRLFQERKATPYDRLEDGTTFLHVRRRILTSLVEY